MLGNLAREEGLFLVPSETWGSKVLARAHALASSHDVGVNPTPEMVLDDPRIRDLHLALLEGAPALIIFGPLLTPIAVQLGYHPLHFGIILVIAMGIGLFSPPFGLGMYATCTIAQTRLQDVVMPYLRYVAVLLVTLVVLIIWPSLTIWLPKLYGLA